MKPALRTSLKYALDKGSGVNDALASGDPVLDTTTTTQDPLPGPFAGQSINCRACHLVDEHVETQQGGMRTYGDFARRSPVPARHDGQRTTPRNAPPLVNASLKRQGGTLFHFDAEFVSLEDLTASTLTGRNFGWLVGEKASAVAHIARVIREDNGSGALAQDFGGVSYPVALAGTDPTIPPAFRLPKRFRLDVTLEKTSDQEIVDTVAKLIAVYVRQLLFAQDEQGNFHLSPFDVFLASNSLPQQPRRGETGIAYSRRLLTLILKLEHKKLLAFVTANPHETDGQFKFHDQAFRFGPLELAGLKIFFTMADHSSTRSADRTQGGVGNCIACHVAPIFTDFRFHNTGTTQREYDSVHGEGAFQRLYIPTLHARRLHPNAYLPATALHPQAKEPFRAVPSKADPTLTDLGLWNIFANPDFPQPQFRLWRLLCEDHLGEIPHDVPGLALLHALPRCSPAVLLQRTIAAFKTPGLRDLGHGAPYMHNGQFDTLKSIIGFYGNVSELARAGRLRNGAAPLKDIALTPQDVEPLEAFLKSLNEDYE